MSAASRSIVEALARAESDLALVLQYRAILLPQHLRPLTLDAWPLVSDRLAHLQTTLKDAPDTIDDQLGPAGLTGVELEMKLFAHRMASERARQARPPRSSEPARPFRRIFKSLLGWLDVWLDSLFAAIGGGEAIKEFKKFLEQGVDDAENLGELPSVEG